jgi:hypothetical protein
MNLSIEFRNIIKRISHNRIASIIWNIEGKSENYDYIMPSDNNNIVSFLTPKRVAEITVSTRLYSVSDIRNLTHSSANDEIFEKIGYNKHENEYWYPVPGDDIQSKGTIINECISDKTGRTYVLFKCHYTGRLSVVNKSVIIPVDIDFFQYSKNKIKIGRLVSNILSDLGVEFKPREIEEFVNLYKSSYDILSNKEIMFRIIKGDEIANWYHINNYESDRKGSLASSCMAFKEPDYFDLYTKNDNCSMLVLLSDSGTLKDGQYSSDKISGRAIVWKGILNNKGEKREITLMDRVYTNNDSDTRLFTEYAKGMGWFYKLEQTRNSDTPITNGEEIINFFDQEIGMFTSEFLVPLENYILDKYPYVDTVPCLKDNCLSNIINLFDENKDYGCRYFRTTNGGYELIA